MITMLWSCLDYTMTSMNQHDPTMSYHDRHVWQWLSTRVVSSVLLIVFLIQWAYAQCCSKLMLLGADFCESISILFVSWYEMVLIVKVIEWGAVITVSIPVKSRSQCRKIVSLEIFNFASLIISVLINVQIFSTRSRHERSVFSMLCEINLVRALDHTTVSSPS